MLKNFIIFGTLKLAFSLIVMSLIITQANSQAPKSEITQILDDNYSYSANKNGTISSIHFIKNLIPTTYLQFQLNNLKVFGKNLKNQNKTEEIEDYSYDTSAVDWTLSESPDQISLTYKNIYIYIFNNLRRMGFSLQNADKFPKDILDKYTDIYYQYTFDYKSKKPYNYKVWNAESGITPLKSGIDVIEFNDKDKISMKENNFTVTVMGRELEFFHTIQTHKPDKKESVINDLKEGDVTVLYDLFGGRTNITQNNHTNCPKNYEIAAVYAFNLNKNNEVEERNANLINFKNSISNSTMQKYDNHILFQTHTFGQSGIKVNQTFSVFPEDFTVNTFTNQERLLDENAFYNLGEGINYINKGDIQLTYDIKDYKLPENVVDKEFGPSQFFEMGINVNIIDIDYKNDINKGLFFTYASLETDNKESKAKIVSVKVNNKEEGSSSIDGENFITIRTTPFEGDIKIKFLFKSFESKQKNPSSGNAMLYIIIALIAACLIGSIVFFFLRREKIRKASEDVRLNEISI